MQTQDVSNDPKFSYEYYEVLQLMNDISRDYLLRWYYNLKNSNKETPETTGVMHQLHYPKHTYFEYKYDDPDRVIVRNERYFVKFDCIKEQIEAFAKNNPNPHWIYI